MEHIRNTMVMKINSQNIWLSAADVNLNLRLEPVCPDTSALTMRLILLIPTSERHTAKLHRTVTAINSSMKPPYRNVYEAPTESMARQSKKHQVPGKCLVCFPKPKLGKMHSTILARYVPISANRAIARSTCCE